MVSQCVASTEPARRSCATPCASPHSCLQTSTCPAGSLAMPVRNALTRIAAQQALPHDSINRGGGEGKGTGLPQPTAHHATRLTVAYAVIFIDTEGTLYVLPLCAVGVARGMSLLGARGGGLLRSRPERVMAIAERWNLVRCQLNWRVPLILAVLTVQCCCAWSCRMLRQCSTTSACAGAPGA